MPPSDFIPPPLSSFEPERLQRKDALGETWRALDRQSGNKVDLRLLPEWVDTEELSNWVRHLKPASHSAIITTHQVISEEGRSAIVLEACDGETIPQRRSRRPRRHFEVSEVKPWLRQIVEAIEFLHSRDIAHGALHTGSFLIDGTDLKLADLAISRLMRPQAHLEGAAALPLAVMSPQVLQCAPPERADDLYALGALVYDLLTGAPVFHSGDIPTQILNAPPISIMARRAQLEIQSAPVPQSWEDWLQAALSKDPAQRPGVGELAELIRSGTFRGATTNTRAAAAKKTPYATQTAAAYSATPASPPAGSPRPSAFSRVSPNHLIIAAAALLILGVSAGVYFGKIAPRNAFKDELNAAYTAAQLFDDENGHDHAAAIAKWDGLVKSWQTRVTTVYPDFQPILDAAKEKLEDHRNQAAREVELAKADAAEARRQYIAKVRVQFITAQASASSTDGPGVIAIWSAFLKQYDVPYEGETLTELAKELGEARALMDQQTKALADEQRMIAEAQMKAEADLARLHQNLSDPAAGAGHKITLIETYLTSVTTLAASALTDKKITELRQTAEAMLPPLRVMAEAEMPKEPLALPQLFGTSPAKDFSENGKKRLLAAAQAKLKENTLYQGEPDGATGQSTHEAIIAFQKSKNLIPSGTLDDRTLAALGVAEVKDDPTPMAAVASAANAVRRSTSSRSKSSKPEEKKGFFQKVGDGATGVGKSIGGFFTGKGKEKEKEKGKKK